MAPSHRAARPGARSAPWIPAGLLGSSQMSKLLALLALAALALPAQERPPLPVDSLPRELPDALPLGLEGALPAASAAEVALGRRLFFDPLLSLDRTVACASCHEPEHGFAGKERFSLGVGGQR